MYTIAVQGVGGVSVETNVEGVGGPPPPPRLGLRELNPGVLCIIKFKLTSILAKNV